MIKDAKFWWTESRTNTLKSALMEMTQDPHLVHTQDPFYWISHYRFDGLIPVKDVRRKVVELMQDFEATVRQQ